MLIEEQLGSFSFQVKEALKIREGISLKRVNRIIIFGMGGSGCSGTLFRDFLSDKISLPIVVSKNIPVFVDSKTLVFVLSYSGNTRETIKLYNYAKKKTDNIFILTSGGKLGSLRNAKIVHIPKGFAPRESVVFMVSAMLVLIGKKSYLKRFSELEKFNKDYAKRLAKKFYKKIPVIYAGEEKLSALAYKWKINFNETSKVFAHCNFFTEVNHNEIEAVMPRNAKIVVLLNKKNPDFSIFKKFFNFEEIELKGSSELEKLFYGVLLGDYVAYYLGLMNKKNPLKTLRIERLKKAMN